MEHAETKNKQRDVRLPEHDVDKPDELFYDEDFEKYLADRSCVSSSGVRKMMESPRHFLASVMESKEEDDADEPAHYRFGKAAHMMILEPAKFREYYVTQPDFGPMQSIKNREKRDAWKEGLPAGALVLTEKEIDMLTNMVNSLQMHPEASQFFKAGKPEVTGRFTHKKTGIRCRIRPDYISYNDQGELFIFDIKTTRTTTKGLFATDAAKKKYHCQLAYYADGMAQITGREPSAVALVAMEKVEPYSVFVYWMDDEDLKKGRELNDFALANLKRSLTTGKWPGPQAHGEMMSLPMWAKDEMPAHFDYGD